MTGVRVEATMLDGSERVLEVEYLWALEDLERLGVAELHLEGRRLG